MTEYREVFESIRTTRLSFLDGLATGTSRRLDKDLQPPRLHRSMNVMEAEGITEILTSDHNFEQEGFTILMKPSR